MKKFELPLILSRSNPRQYKNNFGHVFILAGSAPMLGAAALTALSVMRSGAGLVTLGVPQSLNPAAQKKISNVIMTLPLRETKDHCVSSAAFKRIKEYLRRCNVLALGPGLSRNPSAQKLVLRLIKAIDLPVVIDADGLNNLAGHLRILKKQKAVRILTPHPGEMARLIKVSIACVESDRKKTALRFAKKYNCVVLLKGHRTIVASPDGRVTINGTGNVGMATAGSGDVLTGVVSSFIAQGVETNQAVRSAAYIHGLAGDLAAKDLGKASLIATDLIDYLPQAFKKLSR